MEDLKHEHCEQAAIYEEQIRKFRELIQDREKENGYLQTKLKQQQMDSQLEFSKLQQELEKAKKDLSSY